MRLQTRLMCFLMVVVALVAASTWFVKSTEPLLVHIGVCLLTLALAAGLMTVLLNQHLGAPLRQLMALAEEAERGALNQRIKVRGTGEIAALGVSLNRMLDSIVENRDAAARQQLERLRLLELLRGNDRERTVDYLVAELAHELASPLNVVQGRAEMILEHTTQNDPTFVLARTIAEQGKRMADVIGARVDRSRRHAPVSTRQPVGEVVRRAQNLLQPILRDWRVDLLFVEEPGIVAVFEAERLLSVVTSLILTVARTSDPGSRIELHLSRVVAESSVPARVEPGRFALLRIISPQPDPDSHLLSELKLRDEGLGLSYSICEGIVADLGGFIELTSAAGYGTAFSVFLPKTSTTGTS